MRRLPTRGLVIITSVVIGALAEPPLRGQLSDAKPTFEVVSITPHKSIEQGGSLRFLPGGRFQGTNVYILAVIAAAFGDRGPLLPERIDGGPAWIRFDRFDIAAKTSATIQNLPALYDQLPALLKPVLEERLRLKTHWETRRLPVFALVVARKDGKLGPQMRTSHCTPRPEMLRSAGTATQPEKGLPLCTVTTLSAGAIEATGLSIVSLAAALSTSLARVVLDRTGLAENFDMKLQWAADSGTQGNNDPNIPPLSTALLEQLGLKLESTKGPVDILVIDHVEKPTPD